MARHVRRDALHKSDRLVARYGQGSTRTSRGRTGSDVHLVRPVGPSAFRDLLAGVHPAAEHSGAVLRPKVLRQLC